MEPKEKAKELVEMYEPYCYHERIECALIAVDEIINEKEECHSYECGGNSIGYWKRVEQEIEKL